MDCSPWGSSVHGILLARVLEWLAIPFSSRSSQLRDWTLVSHIAGRFFTMWATWEGTHLRTLSIQMKTESFINFSSVQLLSHVQLFAAPWTTACQASLSITNYRSLPRPMSTESVRPSNHLILCHHLLLLPSVFSNIKVFSNESALRMRWPKYWKFSFNISPSNEHPGLISFRMDWLDLIAVQGPLKSLLQHQSSKHQFFGAQLSL